MDLFRGNHFGENDCEMCMERGPQSNSARLSGPHHSDRRDHWNERPLSLLSGNSAVSAKVASMSWYWMRYLTGNFRESLSLESTVCSGNTDGLMPFLSGDYIQFCSGAEYELIMQMIFVWGWQHVTSSYNRWIWLVKTQHKHFYETKKTIDLFSCKIVSAINFHYHCAAWWTSRRVRSSLHHWWPRWVQVIYSPCSRVGKRK